MSDVLKCADHGVELVPIRGEGGVASSDARLTCPLDQHSKFCKRCAKPDGGVTASWRETVSWISGECGPCYNITLEEERVARHEAMLEEERVANDAAWQLGYAAAQDAERGVITPNPYERKS